MISNGNVAHGTFIHSGTYYAKQRTQSFVSQFRFPFTDPCFLYKCTTDASVKNKNKQNWK